MSIYKNLESIRKLSTSSLTSIIDITNLNFNNLSDAVLEFLNKIQYNESTNSLSVYKGSFEFIDVTNTVSWKLDGITTFTIDSLGRAEGQELLVKVAESKRYRHTDFPDWPDEGVPGEIIYTGIQNQRPEFGEDFIGYLDGRGWVSLTTPSGPFPFLKLTEIIGSPPTPPSTSSGNGVIWIGSPGYETTYEPTTQTVYFTDENGNTYDILSDFVWEKIINEGKFKLSGKAIIGDNTNNGQLQYIDGNQAVGFVLTSDASGNASWQPAAGGPGPGPSNTAFVYIGDFVANVPQTITHALGTESVHIQLIDLNTNENIEGYFDNYQLNNVDVTLNQNRNNVKVVILAAGGVGGSGGSYTGGSVNVYATGTDNYVGTSGSPGITSLEIDVIYLVQFENANTGVGSPASAFLDIDGTGSFPIFKGSETGLVDLDANDIVPSVTYYVIWDGTQFQLFESSPAASDFNYTNLNPIPVTIGGVNAGTVFNNTSVNGPGGVLDTLFYPYLVPNFTGFAMSAQPSIIEVGQTVNNISRTFTWSASNPGSIAPNSILIKNITGGVVTLISGLANDGSETFNLPSPISYSVATFHKWRIQATRTNLSTMILDYQINWRWRRFWGTSTLPFLTESDIESLSNSGLAANRLGTFSYSTGGYKYFCIPPAFGTPLLFRDQSTNLAVAMADSSDGYTDTDSGAYNFQYVSVTNPYGVTANYKVYRTKYILGGAIDIIVT